MQLYQFVSIFSLGLGIHFQKKYKATKSFSSIKLHVMPPSFLIYFTVGAFRGLPCTHLNHVNVPSLNFSLKGATDIFLQMH